MKVGLFGGSFDPIHIGHIELAKEAIEQLDLDEFYFIPTKHNPWKNNSIASDEDRVKMIEIAIRDEEKLHIERVELDWPDEEKNYTIKTIKVLKNAHPDVDYYYFMGMDQVCHYHEWKKAKKLSKKVQLVAFNRGGYPDKHENLKKFNFIKIDNSSVLASSTEIREGNIAMLDGDVLRYISSHGLYLDTMIKNRMCEKRYLHSLSVANLCVEFAKGNGVDPLDAYIAGVMHDVAKEMDMKVANRLMSRYFPDHLKTAKPIWHQWLSRYVCEHDFLIENQDILKAIEDHTTGSTTMTQLGKCLYCADKLDPLRGYDSSKQIEICKQDIDEGFRNELTNFYEFSKQKGRSIDPLFYDIYKTYVKGTLDD